MHDSKTNFDAYFYKKHLKPQKSRLIFADVIDLAAMISIFFVLIQSSNNPQPWTIAGLIVLTLVIYEVFIVSLFALVFKFPSLGHFLTGTILISAIYGTRYDAKHLLSYRFKRFGFNLFYPNAYQTVSFFSSELNQTPTMQRTHTLAANYKTYKHMLQHNKLTLPESSTKKP